MTTELSPRNRCNRKRSSRLTCSWVPAGVCCIPQRCRPCCAAPATVGCWAASAASPRPCRTPSCTASSTSASAAARCVLIRKVTAWQHVDGSSLWICMAVGASLHGGMGAEVCPPPAMALYGAVAMCGHGLGPLPGLFTSCKDESSSFTR